MRFRLPALLDGPVVLRAVWPPFKSYPDGTRRNENVTIQQGHGVFAVYGHLDSFLAALGTNLKAGDPIALSGNSGYVLPQPTPTKPDSGSHLHLQMHKGTYKPGTNLGDYPIIDPTPYFTNYQARGGADDMTNEQIVRAAAKGLQFTDDYAQAAVDNWMGHLDAGGDLAAMLRQFAIDSVQFHTDEEALEIYQQARENAGSPYPGGAKQFAIDRVMGGASFRDVMNVDIRYYIERSQALDQILAQDTVKLTEQDEDDLELGRGFRAIIKEANG
jgi:hypothetical protein